MEDNTEPLRFLTTHETAELLQVSRRTMERMINRKDLPAFKIGSQWRVHETALATWLEGLQARKPLNQSE
jgi:excisionase family DNA binding protein